MNGAELTAGNEILEEIYLKIADGKMSREDLEKFFSENIEYY